MVGGAYGTPRVGVKWKNGGGGGRDIGGRYPKKTKTTKNFSHHLVFRNQVKVLHFHFKLPHQNKWLERFCLRFCLITWPIQLNSKVFRIFFNFRITIYCIIDNFSRILKVKIIRLKPDLLAPIVMKKMIIFHVNVCGKLSAIRSYTWFFSMTENQF